MYGMCNNNLTHRYTALIVSSIKQLRGNQAVNMRKETDVAVAIHLTFKRTVHHDTFL